MLIIVIQSVLTILFILIGILLSRSILRGVCSGVAVGLSAQLITTIMITWVDSLRKIYTLQLPAAFYIEYVLLTMAIGVILGTLYLWVSGTITFRFQRGNCTWRTWLLSILFLLLGIAAAVVFFICLWVNRNFGYITPDDVRFFLVGDTLTDLTPAMYRSVWLKIILPMLACGILSAITPIFPLQITLSTWRRKTEIPVQQLRFMGKCTAVLLMVSALGASCLLLPLIGTTQTFVEKSNFIEENYVEPTDKLIHFPAKPKNLVHIFLESMENSYYSKAEGGYLEKSLMPDLAQLTRENVSFSHTNKFGGPHQTLGATHSIAGIINMQTGVPMVPVSFSRQWTLAYSDLPNLGRILHKHGYVNEYMLGGKRNFHQLGTYFTNYADFQMFDSDTAKARGIVPPDYNVWWGVEDDKLYEYAKTEITALGNGKKPFYFLLENADTHHNDGYLSPRIKEFPSDKQYGNVIHYSQREVVKIVRWMQQQPWYKDTVIVLTGDHRSKDITFFKGWDEKYERTIVNIIINGAESKPTDKITKNRSFAPFDLFPTIVSAMGIKIDGERLGLGTNLYSGLPTLMEQKGVTMVSDEFRKRSKFYEKHLIRDLTKKEISDTFAN